MSFPKFRRQISRRPDTFPPGFHQTIWQGTKFQQIPNGWIIITAQKSPPWATPNRRLLIEFRERHSDIPIYLLEN